MAKLKVETPHLLISEEGPYIVIKLKKEPKGRKSASEKSILVATTGGNKPVEFYVDGQQVTLGVNMYIPIK